MSVSAPSRASAEGALTLRGLLVFLVLAASVLAQEFRPGRVTNVDGYRVQVDEAKATFEIETEEDVDPKVKELGAKFVPTFRIHPTFAAARRESSFVIPSVAEIDALICEIDDRLIASLELLMDRGLPGQFIGRAAVLRKLEAAVCGGGGPACAFLAAAQEIGGAELGNRPERAEIDAFKSSFKATAAATPSIGIYSSSPELDRLFQQAKFLQQRFDANGSLMAALRQALVADAALGREYRVLNDLPAVITS
jgi:hypothetical protein